MKPYPPVYWCPWCGVETDHPLDILSSNCRCCGSDVMGIIRPCAHRTKEDLMAVDPELDDEDVTFITTCVVNRMTARGYALDPDAVRALVTSGGDIVEKLLGLLSTTIREQEHQ